MPRYVISRRSTGLGDCMVSLIAAWRYARDTNRVLVADWRHSVYLHDGWENAFAKFFKPVEILAGVPFVCSGEVSRVRFPEPCYPPCWTSRRIHRRLFRSDSDLERASTEMAAMIRDRTDREEPTVVLDACMANALPPDDEAREMVDCLRPLAVHQARIDAFRSAEFAGRRMVGIHVRHGNGGNIMLHGKYWADEMGAVRRCTEAVKAAMAALGPDCGVFLCTDSPVIEDLFRAMYPHLITRPKGFAPAGAGELHDPRFATRGAADALIEMYLLAACDVVVRFPPNSFFSYLAALGRTPLRAPTVPAAATPPDLQAAMAPAIMGWSDSRPA
jgi:hypothetical protein